MTYPAFTTSIDRFKLWLQGLRIYGALYLTIPLAFFLLMLLFFSFQERFEFDPDEGLNAMKSLLLIRGYPLYSEIWSDQPPLFTYLLAAIMRVFGVDINTLRTFVLFLSSILIGSAYLVLNMTWGKTHAFAGAFLIFLLPYYKSLSVSVMIGLPAITFAMLSMLSLVIWHRGHRSFWLVFSALTLGLSVLTKLFTGFLAPIFILGILIDQKNRLGGQFNWFALLYPAFIWTTTFSCVVLLLGLILVGPANINQLISTHLSARSIEEYSSRSDTIATYLHDSIAIILLAIVGSIYALLKRSWITLYLIAWAVGGYLLLSIQVPVWYHHQLLITIPMAMLSGIAIGETMRILHQLFRTGKFLDIQIQLSVLTIIGIALALATRVPQTYYDFRIPIDQVEPISEIAGREQRFLNLIASNATETQWIITDLPMYAFRNGLPVPPPLAVFSEKRMLTGDLTEDQIIEIFKKYQPEQVLIGRFKLLEFEGLLKNDYRRVFFREGKHLYKLDEPQQTP
jgi:hypothetical protein